MLNFKKCAAFIFTIFLFFTSTAPALALTYSPGVALGQFVKYGNFVGTGPGFEDFANYDSLTLQITNVAGTQVTFLSTGEYKNGTAVPGNNTIIVWDVSAGTENGNPKTQSPIIAANLNAGNAIPPSGTYTINSTENRQFLGVTRSVNILGITLSSPDYNSSFTYIYDKASGMLLDSSSLTTVQGESGPVASEYSYSIIETNIFTPNPSVPETTFLFAGAIAIAATLVAVCVLRRKRI